MPDHPTPEPRAKPEELCGSFVVEVGLRQAWPFVGFGRQDGSEARLYVGAPIRLSGQPGDWLDEEDDATVLPGLAELNGMIVISATVAPDATLELVFEGGRVMYVTGVPGVHTTGDVWWLSTWLLP